MKNKSNILVIGAVLVVALVLIMSAKNIFGNSKETNPPVTPPTEVGSTGTSNSNNGVASIKLHMSGYKYIMEPSSLKKGIPVRIEVDLSTVSGCMQDIVIPAFNVRKYVRPGDNVIEFTPDKEGTFSIVCSMNMGKGTFTVINSDSAAAQDPAPNLDTAQTYSTQGQPACNMDSGSGGCGCHAAPNI